MKTYLNVIVFFLNTFLFLNAQTWTPTGGPYGGYILSIVLHPNNDNIVFCGTQGGDIYKTVNGGEQWYRLENLKSDILSMAIDPTNPDILYAGTKSNSIYRSTNNGITWNNLNLSNNPINAIAIDKNNTSILYAGVYDSGVFKSSDSGLNWLPINVGITDDRILSLVINPNDSQNLYCGTYYYAFKTTTGGATWIRTDNNINGNYFRIIAIDPLNANTLYVGTDYGVYKSTNSGDSWNRYANGLTNNNIHSLAVDPYNTTTLYTGSEDGLFKSFTSGSSWTSNFTIPPHCIVEEIVVSPLNSNIIYIGFQGEGIYKTTDGGINWNEINYGISNLIVWDIVSHPNNPNILFAGTEIGGIYRTTNGGTNWENVKQRIFDVYALAFDPINPNIIYAGTYGEGIYKSIDNGTNWSQINIGLSDKKIWSIAVDPTNPMIVYTATDNNGVYKSADGGLQWVEVNYLAYGSYRILINPTNSNILYVGSYADIQQSSNAGSSWSDLAGNFSNEYIVALAFKEGSPNTIYFGGGGINSWDGTIYGGIYRMTLDGTTWYKLVDKVYSTDIVINPDITSEIYSSTRNDGIYCTRNSGDVWFKINNGLPSLVVDDLCISGNSVFAALRYGSVWKTNTVTNVDNNDELISGNYFLSQNYPNPFNPTTTISYSIPKTQFVTLKIYDVLGKEVASLVNEEKLSGNYEIKFNGSSLPSGVYFYRLSAGNFTQTKKLLLLK